ncbi:MAG: 2-oxoacid:acceptor oxidoreductase family protein, partial [Muribaculaceae bacterium]|nr:2-oxoacid:acceptor oxidoreductase family protein [Muribaculaceae bacterium]
IAVILHQQSLAKFESHVKPGGLLIYDPYGIHRRPTRTDIRCVPIGATEASVSIGNAKAFNMILLGALLQLQPMVSADTVITGLKKTLPERHHHLIPMNREAIDLGARIAAETVSKL